VKTAPESAVQSRLDEIEAKLSFNEDLLDELSRTVFRQQEQIDLLQQELRVLYQQLKESTTSGQRNLADETPPHY
jgi:SlyX protein